MVTAIGDHNTDMVRVQTGYQQVVNTTRADTEEMQQQQHKTQQDIMARNREQRLESEVRVDAARAEGHKTDLARRVESEKRAKELHEEKKRNAAKVRDGIAVMHREHEADEANKKRLVQEEGDRKAKNEDLKAKQSELSNRLA